MIMADFDLEPARSVESASERENSRRCACDRCRGQKVRCEREPGSRRDGPCRRCSKANARCTFNVDKEATPASKHTWDFDISSTMESRVTADATGRRPRQRQRSLQLGSSQRGHHTQVSMGTVFDQANNTTAPKNMANDWDASSQADLAPSLSDMFGQQRRSGMMAYEPNIASTESAGFGPWTGTRQGLSADRDVALTSVDLLDAFSNNHSADDSHDHQESDTVTEGALGTGLSAQSPDPSQASQDPLYDVSRLNSDIIDHLSALHSRPRSVEIHMAPLHPGIGTDIESCMLPSDAVERALQFTERLLAILHDKVKSPEHQQSHDSNIEHSQSSQNCTRESGNTSCGSGMWMLCVATSFIGLVRLQKTVLQRLNAHLGQAATASAALQHLVLPSLRMGKYRVASGSAVRLEAVTQLLMQMLQQVHVYAKKFCDEGDTHQQSLLSVLVEREGLGRYRHHILELFETEMALLRHVLWKTT